ncbi:MAG TPA: hypothetical protein VHX62_16765 [Solirubrobacteraceae bacterium]|jgi:hypothetical protein|nr:hypothetical protein [Solirubrobacteraceae bacterium]
MTGRDRRRLIAGLALPLVAFLVLRRALGNATGALAITDAIPVVWIIAVGVWRRELAGVAVLSAVIFAIALGLTITFGDSSLPLELRRSVFPGALGLACLISIAIGRPLLAVAAARAAAAAGGDRGPASAGTGDRGAAGASAHRPGARIPDPDRLNAPGSQRVLRTLTAMIGVALVADAAAQVVLALTVSTATFAEVARVASYVIIGGGLAVCALYLRAARSRLADQGQREPPADPRPGPPPEPDPRRRATHGNHS